MPAAVYTRLLATANRLIAKYGKPATIVRDEKSGPAHAPVLTPIDYPCMLVDVGYSLTDRKETMIQTGDKVGILSAAAQVAPTMDDRLRIDGTEYGIVDLQPLNPGGVVLLYEYVART